MKRSKPMTALMATRTLRYATRMLTAGERFEAPDKDARLLIAARRARPAPPPRDPVELAAPPAGLVAKLAPAPAQTVRFSPPSTAFHPLDHDQDGAPGGSATPADGGDIKALRAEYSSVFGKRPFPGWGADILRQKIAAAD